MHVPQIDDEMVVIEPLETKSALVGSANGNGTQLALTAQEVSPAKHEHHNHSHNHKHSHGSNGSVPGQQQTKRPSRNMNMHGVFLHVLADALGSVIVIISALIVAFTEWRFNVYVDPGLSVIMVVIITYTTIPLRKI